MSAGKADAPPLDPPSLDELRRRIDAIDDQILALIEQRLEASRAVAIAKASEEPNPLWLRPDRENAILEKLRGKQSRVPPQLIERLWRELMGFSLQTQATTTLKVFGASVEALMLPLRQRFGAAAPVEPAASMDEAFLCARSGAAVAIIAGVADILPLLPPDLRSFDTLRDEDGSPVAAIVARASESVVS